MALKFASKEVVVIKNSRIKFQDGQANRFA